MERVVADLRAHAEQAFPEECCGALVRDARGEVTVRRLENVAADRRRRFEVGARELLALEREGDVLGLYHSHPDGPAVPSLADADTAWSGRATIIVPVLGGVAGAPRVFHFDERTRAFHEGALS